MLKLSRLSVQEKERLFVIVLGSERDLIQKHYIKNMINPFWRDWSVGLRTAAQMNTMNSNLVYDEMVTKAKNKG